MASAPIGEIPVIITGDWSDLQNAIEEAAAAATIGAQQIADAFSNVSTGDMADAMSGAGDALSGFGDTIDTEASGLDALTEAVGTASQAFEELASVVADASGSLAEVNSSVTEIASSAAAVGEDVSLAAEGFATLDKEADSSSGSLAQAAQSFSAFDDAASAAEGSVGELAGSFEALQSVDTSTLAELLNSVAALAASVAALAASVDTLAESMNTASEGAGKTAENIEEIPAAEHDAEAGSEDLIERFKEMLETGLELAGISLALEAIKEAIEECIEAFGEFQRAGEALAAISGDAAAASEALEKIPELADAIGQAIPALEEAQQKFARFGVDLENMPALLTAVSDAARASGNSFDSVASSFERMDNTGKVMGRTLHAAGLSMDDLAKAMNMVGASQADITKAFADLGTGAEGAAARAQVLIDATQRFAGISAATANDVDGSWQQIKNSLHEAMVNIGASLALLGGAGGVDVFKLGIKGIETFIVSMIGYAQQAEDILVGLGKVALDVFMNIGRAAASAAKGDWTSAWQAIQNGWTAVASDVKDTTQKMVDDWTANGKIIDHIWDQTTASVESNTHKHIQGVVNDLATIQATLDKFAERAVNVLNSIPATEDVYLTQLQAGGEKATQILSQINQALALGMKDMGNLQLNASQIAGMQALIDKLSAAKVVVQGFVDTDALAKLGTQVQALADKFPQALGELDPAIQEWVRQITNITNAIHQAAQTSDRAQLLANLLETQKAFDDMATSMQKSWQAGTDAQTTATTKMLQDIGAFTDQTVSEVQSIGKNWMDVAATVQTSGAKQAVVYAALKALKIDDIGLDQQQQTALRAVLTIMQSMGSPLREQLGVQAQILQDQLKIGEAQGATAQQTLLWTEQLQGVQTQMNVLKDQSQGLANLYTQMVSALGKAWTDLGKGLGDALVSGQNFGQAMAKVFDTLKQQIAELVTQYLLNQLKDAFLQNTNAVSDFGKVFNAIFGGGGNGGIIGPGLSSAGQAIEDFSDNDVIYFGEAAKAAQTSGKTIATSMQQTAQSVQTSASQMVTSLTAIAAVISAIASIFGDIEMAHMETLLTRIEASTRYTMIYTGQQSQSILWSTQTTAAFTQYIHETIVQMSGDVQAIRSILTTMLGVISAEGIGGGGTGGGTAAAFQALQEDLDESLKVFGEEISGPYGLGPAVQGVAADASAASGSLDGLSIIADTASASLAAVSTAATTATGDINTMTAAAAAAATASTAVTEDYSTLTSAIATATTATAAAAQIISEASNAMATVASVAPSTFAQLSSYTPMTPAQTPYTVQVVVNNTGPVVGSGGMQQFTQMIQDGIVQSLTTRGVRVTRG